MKIPVPPGFVITVDAFKHFLEKDKLGDIINSLVDEINSDDFSVLKKNSEKIILLVSSLDCLVWSFFHIGQQISRIWSRE